MNSLQVEWCLKKLPVQNVGVFPSDCLPIKITPSTAFVVNTDPHTKTGTHWIAIYLDKHQRLEYFDSSGKPPTVPDHVNFIRRNCWQYHFNHNKLQGDFSPVCGHYCLTYLYFRLQGYSMQDYVSQFSTNVNQNDFHVCNMFDYCYKGL